jgi:hypothetical protein
MNNSVDLAPIAIPAGPAPCEYWPDEMMPVERRSSNIDPPADLVSSVARKNAELRKRREDASTRVLRSRENAFTTPETLRNPKMNPNPHSVGIPSAGLFGSVKPRSTEMNQSALADVKKLCVFTDATGKRYGRPHTDAEIRAMHQPIQEERAAQLRVTAERRRRLSLIED